VHSITEVAIVYWKGLSPCVVVRVCNTRQSLLGEKHSLVVYHLL